MLSLVGVVLAVLGLLPLEDEHLTSTPLPRREASDGARFERLEADATGIDFVHRWDHTPETLHLLGNAMTGGGVALGDANGDGQTDVLLTRPTGGQRLYVNQGELRFADGTEAAGLEDDSWSNGATFGDVDGDGHLDLIVCGYGRPNRLWTNGGDGTFRERGAEAGLDFTGASIMFSLADYDLDGDLDGYLLTNRFAGAETPDQPVPYVDGKLSVPPELIEEYDVIRGPGGAGMLVTAAQFDHLYRNDGKGAFTDVSDAAGIDGNHFGLAATWWDADGDGRPDLYVANDFFGPDKLYRNDGQGTFTDIITEALPHTPWFSMGADSADIDNDGRLDLITSDMLPTERFRRQVAMGELASALWFSESVDPPQYMRNALFVNTGTERFLEVAWMAGLAASNWTWSTVFGDLDEDGWVDLFVSNGMTRDFFHSDRRMEAARVPSERRMAEYWLPRKPLHEANLAFRNEGELSFASVGEGWGLAHVGASFGAILGDLDGDGDLDVVTNDYLAPAGVYRNRSHEGHRISLTLVGAGGNTQGLGATVRVETDAGEQMRYVTLARGFMAAGDGRVHFGLGGAERVRRLTVAWPGGRVQELADLEVDRAYVLTEPTEPAADEDVPEPPAAAGPRFARREGPAIRETAYDDFATQPLLPYGLSRLGPGLAVADVDADGDDDFLVGGPTGSSALLMRNDGTGLFAAQPQEVLELDAFAEDMGVLFFEADGDGDLDLYVVSGGVEGRAGSRRLADRLYLNNGQGTFQRAPRGSLPSARDAGGVVAAADVDRDGDLDLFVGGRTVPGAWPAPPTSRLLLNDGGRFTDGTAERAAGLEKAGLVTSALWTDVDDDGWLDLLLTREFGSVKLWRNAEGQLADDSEAAGLLGRRGLWNGIAGRDLDGDGDMDYVVTNLGLNTRYRASAEVPWTILAGDLDGGGVPRLLEVEHDRGELHALRSRTSVIGAMPVLAPAFPTFESWATATLSEIIHPQAWPLLQQIAATELASGVLVNDGQGAFTFSALPRRAQVAPGFGVVLTEIDGDGVADLYLVGNQFSPQPETGRFDGGIGLALRGRGDATFEPLSPAETGLVVPGDARSLVATDVDGDTFVDFIVGVNDSPFLLFQQLGDPERTNFVVRLRGKPGNPTAVGAQVTVMLPDGSRQTAEVSAGGGYVSQSSSALVFGLGGQGQVARLGVRWPDGSRDEVEPGPEDRIVNLEQR